MKPRSEISKLIVGRIEGISIPIPTSSAKGNAFFFPDIDNPRSIKGLCERRVDGHKSPGCGTYYDADLSIFIFAMQLVAVCIYDRDVTIFESCTVEALAEFSFGIRECQLQMKMVVASHGNPFPGY